MTMQKDRIDLPCAIVSESIVIRTYRSHAMTSRKIQLEQAAAPLYVGERILGTQPVGS